MTKKLLLASTVLAGMTAAASAADLSRRAPPPVFTPVPVFTWTGFYAGLESVYTFSDRQRITTLGNTAATVDNVNVGRRPPVTSIESDGFGNVGGGAGYNYQFTPGSGFVVGVAANVDWTDIQKRRGVFGVGNLVAPGIPNPSNFRQSLEYLGTATGKLGYAFDRFLVYGTGGFAFGEVQYDAKFYTPAFALQFAGRYQGLDTGYVYGGGVEYAIPTDSFLNAFAFAKYLGLKYDAVTIKAEYLHYDLGSRNVLVGPVIPSANSYTSRFRTEGSIVKVGFNYKFGGY
ncbi:outer membrane protein [uncultured Methylobacterium sp.]|uniref:outer membrane protein n=1 Tax=uncultured Methylobacterium sp. TaxID=157278 RepID=UPI0035CC8530